MAKTTRLRADDECGQVILWARNNTTHLYHRYRKETGLNQRKVRHAQKRVRISRQELR